jgi:hypothetical protein
VATHRIRAASGETLSRRKAAGGLLKIIEAGL